MLWTRCLFPRLAAAAYPRLALAATARLPLALGLASLLAGFAFFPRLTAREPKAPVFVPSEDYVATSREGFAALPVTTRALRLADLDDPSIAALRRFPKLVALELWNSRALTDAGVAKLATLESLEELSLSWCPRVTNQGLVALAKGKCRLRRLDLTRHQGGYLGPEGSDPRRHELSDEGIIALARGQKELGALVLAGTKLTDAGLRALGGLRKLRRLDLSGTRVTDRGLAILARQLPSLETLELGSLRGLTNAGLAELAALERLERLGLAGDQKTPSRLTRDGLRALPKLKRLRSLDLRGRSEVDDSWLELVARLRGLEELSLSATSVTSAGLAPLTKLRSLRRLELMYVKGLDDAALETFENCAKLEHLALHGTRVSPRALAALRTARPKLEIASD